MKKLLGLSLALLMFCGLSFAQEAGSSYGKAFKINKSLSPQKAVEQAHKGKKLNKVVIVGEITEVCQKKGCWIKLKTDGTSGEDLFVKMEGHSFYLPKDISGKKVAVSGKVKKTIQTVAQQQHFLEDANASQEEIDAITEDKEIISVIANGVQIL